MSKQQMTDKLRKFCVALTGGLVVVGVVDVARAAEWNPVLQEVLQMI